LREPPRLRGAHAGGGAYAVGLYITSAYWFTASTSFANPAVTLARSMSDTFAGIAPAGVAAFIAARLGGMIAAVLLGRWLWRTPARG
jgi:glycerol uptake facilitator-like aquaporin